MKLRSHEILSGTKHPTRSPNPSRFKQIFQKKTLFKKKIQQQPHHHHHGLIHTIPDYVRKSVFRFLLEVKSPSPPPSTRTVRQQPMMGIQALKTKAQPKYSLRLRQQHQQQPPIVDKNKPFEDYQQQNNYDMTILHLNIDDDDDDDDDDSLTFATKTSTNQKKPIPQWARKNELQIAICNQLYFHRNPSEIFGDSMDCSPAHLRTILHSMLPKVQLLDDSFHETLNNSNKSLFI
ncbi:unnamed protein product [Adineta ricciae]|uniref:Inner centromere protein ARK-binding domain-containing protein n=1 Tax=Adineta ricciae TaxID=249248 RepID=A0A813XMB4_ADIRI|nr:unnamed protein product [Adineta ricciae]CAF1606545.1 unnamed protein product [Adineta ricciae]